MAPRPYCDKSSLPADSNDSISTIPNQILTESPSPPTFSGTSTPSPTPLEVIPTESFPDTVYVQEDNARVFASPAFCYPTPGDIMPYDHSLPDFIRQITNQQNLANLQSLSLRVISTLISLHRMSTYLPNLRELDLEGSVLNSLRDIGCSLKNLQILKVGRCQLESLDGTFGLSSLRELYAQKNLINDVSPCSNLPHIRHIDVTGNRIRNISYVGFLSVCSKLRSIVFTGNPATEVSDYRKHVHKILPQIELLDGVPFLNGDNTEVKEVDLIENFCESSDSSSTELPDFLPPSPSESLNNFLEPEEDFFALDKINKHAKNIANQDQLGATDHEDQEVLTKLALQDGFQSINLHQNKAKRGMMEQEKIIENRNKQKYTSIQKLDKDIENRSKKSNLLLNGNINEEIISEESNTIRPSTSKAKINDADDTKATERDSGAIRKRCVSSIPQPAISDKENMNHDWKFSILTRGLPVCGNLTAALIHRKKLRNTFQQKESLTMKTVQTSALQEGSYQFQINDSEDNFDLDCVVENEDDLIAEDVLESSQKWREAFRRYRSNNRCQWEEEEEEEEKNVISDCSKLPRVASKLD